MTRLRFRAAVNPATPNFNKVEDGAEIAFLPLEAVWTGSALDTSGRAIKSTVTSGYTRFQTGDVIVPKITPTFQAGRSAIVPDVPHGIAAGTTELHVVRPFGVDARYALYLVSSQPFLLGGEAEMTGVAGQKRVPDTWLRNFPVFVDDLFRQRLIADFLDRETHRIDSLVEAKQKLIDLLAEKRTALITHAVTKGLNPTVPLKDSGVEWVDRIPESWTLRHLRHFRMQIQTGPFGSQLHADDYVDDGTPIINATHIRDGRIVPESSVSADDATVERLTLHKLQRGDLVFGRRGEAARVAVVGEDEEGWLCGTGSIRVRIQDSDLLPEFAAMVARSTPSYAYFETLGARSTMLNLNDDILRGLPIPTPTPPTQAQIVRYVERASRNAYSTHAALRRQLDLLAEFRQALITAAVTGQLDEATLRGKKPPDEVLEMELPA